MSCSTVSAARLARLRAAYEACGAQAMLVRKTTNIQWLTAFDGVFDEEEAHALLVDGKRAVLHTDSRYATACRVAVAAAAAGAVGAGSDAAVGAGGPGGAAVSAKADGLATSSTLGLSADAASSCPVTVDDSRETHSAFARRLREGSLSDALALEDSIALSEFRALERAFGEGASFVETSNVVFGLRAVKDAEEVARLRAAQAVTDEAFAHMLTFMRPGMTEREVQLELEGYMLGHGASGLAFPSIVATGANGANPHAIPGDTVLEAGQCVVMDFGAKARGYCSDMTRTVFLGEPEGAMLAAWETMRRANESVEAMLRPGVTGREAHELAERILEEGGFGGRMGHGLGHGVGIDIHEEPVLSPRNERALEAGNVVTVEPGIYLPGEFGMRLEDFGIVTEDGFEVFTQSTHDLVVL